MKWFKFAVLNTLRNRRRSATTLLIAALGTAAILLAAGFAEYTYQGLAESAARDAGHLVVARSDYFQHEEDTPLQYGIDNYPALRSRLLADPDVRYLLPRIQFSGLVSNGDKSVIMMATGIDPDSEFLIKGPFLNMKEGSLLSSAKSDTPQILVGEALAKTLKVHPGSGLTLLASTTDGALNALDVQVRGTFSTGVPEYDKRALYTDLETAQRMLVTQKISQLGVYLSDMKLADDDRARIEATAGKGFTTQTWRDQAFFYKSVRELYNRIFGALGGIIAIIVLFVIANAMSMSIIERTREIGTLRALGTLPQQLTRIFAMEGAVLGGAGALVGAVLALIVSVILLYAGIQMPPPPGRSVGYPLSVSINPLIYALVVLGVVVLATLCATLVSRRSARKPIVEALNHV
ncbi:ABC transporter permease [Uliginosibacterium gangwonense]|uniref:ABC transporter permease n=1 Tax=Uliginosibacterium gangwonense TaxID=392736 RepID=UPI00035E2598|nr:FtsX-like permease family protein [Uliginosibacterium gangwonense]